MHDVVIIGGSYAGIAAATPLARARRDVLVLDDGQRRNRFATAAHGLFGQDGVDPGVVAERGKREILSYELNRGRLAVLATSEHSLIQAALVAEWAPRGDTTLFVGPEIPLGPDQRSDLQARGIRIEHAAVVAVEGGDHTATVRLEGGRTIEVAGLFVATRTHVAGPFARELGCALDTHPMGSVYRTDPMTKETTVPGVFACGDAAVPMGSLPFAVADGFRAGVGAHRSLVFPS
jgi:thioredoxin reductase